MWGAPRWLGIDFSGDAGQWGPRRAGNVWVATLERGSEPGPAGPGTRPILADLRRVQQLPGEGTPFDRLAARLAAGDFRAAGIDAPCGLPAAWAGPSHPELLALALGLPRGARPFPRGADLVRAVTGGLPPQPRKPLRESERRWVARGVTVRSTLWVTPRGGAPMTAACLVLLGRAARPVWPFSLAAPGCLAEAFPAAQLRQWALPHRKYAGDEGAARRRVIEAALAPRVELGPFAAAVRASADALDAVLAAFGAMALTDGVLADPPGAKAGTEGWIAVHP